MNTEDRPTSDKVLAAKARRRRVFKRTVWFIVFCWVGLLGVRLWWGHVADRRLQAEIDRCHAAGEPILVEQFQRTTIIPDDENAAVAYQDAHAAMVRQLKTETTISFDDLLKDPRVCEAHPDDVRAYLEANAETLRLIRHARGLRQVDWGTRYASPMINTSLPWLSMNRELAKLARTAVVFHHQNGDHAEAVETLLDIHALGTRINPRGDAFIICHLVAIAIDATALEALEYVAPTLRVADAESLTEAPPRLATHGQISTLIRTLTNEDAMQASAREGFYTERALLLDSGTLFWQGKSGLMGLGGPGYILPISLFRPAFRLDTARMMRTTTRNAEGLLEPNWPAARLKMVKDDEWIAKNSIETASRILSRGLMPSGRAIELHFRMLAMRRMAAVALAIRMYELDHGRRPGSLEELVPDYLDALPADPFAADGRNFGYLPDIASPILYSLNSDGLDDGGACAIKSTGDINLNLKDLPYFLDGNRPRKPLKPASDE